MESMGKKPRRARRSFTPEFKAEIVELCRRGDRSVGQVAKDFDLVVETRVRDWVRQAEIDEGDRAGLTSSKREALTALRRENRRRRKAPTPGPSPSGSVSFFELATDRVMGREAQRARPPGC